MRRRWLVAVVLALALLAVAPAATATGAGLEDGQFGAETVESQPAPFGTESTTVLDAAERSWPVPPPPSNASNGSHAPDEPSGSNESADSNDAPRLASVVPSPSTEGDAGEAVTVAFPAPTDVDGWRLVDDAGHVARLPNRTLSGTVTFSPEPAAAGDSAGASVDASAGTSAGGSTGPPSSDPPSGDAVLPLAGQLRLADDGDALRLVAPDGTVADSVSYDGAREGQRYVHAATGWRWRRPSPTDFEPVAVTPGNATAFVLPDAPGVPLDVLRSADDRVLLAGYTLTSDRVVDALVDAHRDDVSVAVLLDGAPIGGTSRVQVRALDRLTDAGVNVTVLAGERRRFATHHPKYAVVDDRALVLTENWKPAGVGGRSSRGWGVVLPDAAFASALAAVFRADASGRDATAWSDHRSRVDPIAAEPANGAFRQAFEPAEVPVERARLLLAPDNAETELTALLRSADESIRIQQVSVGGLDDPLLQAALSAARNGTTVEILLSSAWYAEAENRRLAADIESLAEREGLPVSVSLIDPAGAFEKNHAKGVIVDDRTVVLGSLNWNPTALRENREVLVVLEGEAVAGYYASVFEADRRSERRWPTPLGLAGAVAVAWLALAAIVATRIRWR